MGNDNPLRDLGKRTDSYVFDPDKLTIITDPNHALYDERINLPLDEAMVRNIMHYGVRVPVSIRIEDDKAVVIDGRQRVMHCREANKRLRERGEEPLMVRAMPERMGDAKAAGVMVALNEGKRMDDVLTKASKAARLINEQNYLIEDVATTFLVGESTIRRWLELDAAPENIKDAMRRGLPIGAALDLAKIRDKTARDEALAKVESEGKVEGKKRAPRGSAASDLAGEEVAKAAAEGKATRQVREREHMRSIKQVRALVEHLYAQRASVKDDQKSALMMLIQTLEWTLGKPESAVGAHVAKLGLSLPRECRDDKEEPKAAAPKGKAGKAPAKAPAPTPAPAPTVAPGGAANDGADDDEPDDV